MTDQALPYQFEFETYDAEVTDSVEYDEAKDEEQEFSFRLFSGMNVPNTFDLKEEEGELIKVERPDNYYLFQPSDSFKDELRSSALSFEDVFRDLSLPPIDPYPHKHKSLNEINKDFFKKRRRQRLGKRQRQLRVERKKAELLQRKTKQTSGFRFGKNQHRRTHSHR